MGAYFFGPHPGNGREAPLRNEVVDKIVSQSQNWEIPGEQQLKQMRKPDQFIESDLEIRATCQVLGINIKIIGKSYNTVFSSSGSFLGQGQPMKGKTTKKVNQKTKEEEEQKIQITNRKKTT